MERGLALVEQGLTTVQAAVRPRDGPAPERSAGRPRPLDRAVSAAANQALRRWRLAATGGARPEALWGDLMTAISRTWRGASPGERLGLPWLLPLSWATLATEAGRRSLAVAATMPAGRIPDFADFAVEVFSDLDTYFSLDYPRELARLEDRLRERPGDGRTRLALGRMLLKCGLFEEAAHELERAARDADLRRPALFELLVARSRAGNWRAAAEAGTAFLELEPGHPQARHWLLLSSDRGGGYDPAVATRHRLTVRAGRAPTEVRFDDVAAEIGLGKTSGGRGTAVFDLDGDGYLDVAICGAHAGLSLFRNRGDGTFSDVSVGSGLESCVYGFAIAVGDYDNDGRPDLFITSLGFYDGESGLYRNNGDGTFTNVTREAGLGCWGPAFTATWVDYDGDGFLDLYLANNLGGLFDRKTPNRLFHNNGDGTFTEVAREAGLHTPWPTIGAAWGDFDNNGLPDLFVSGLGRAQLFRNNGDGTFRDSSREAGVDAPAVGSVALAADVDDDGWLDIVQFTYSRPDEAIYTLEHGEGPPGGSPPRVFLNQRDGTFRSAARELGLTGCWGTMSAAIGDFDNDGRLDLLLGNGDPQLERIEAAALLARDRQGRFRDVTFSAGLPLAGKGHGANMADLAGDGRLHLLMANGGLYPGDLAATSVYRPRRLPGRYLNVRLEGTLSNRDAIGARLELRAGDRSQHRLVSGGTGFGCLPYEQHFGLGRAASVEWLEIRWPSGRRQRLERPPIDTTLRVVEGRDGWREVYRHSPGGRRRAPDPQA